MGEPFDTWDRWLDANVDPADLADEDAEEPRIDHPFDDIGED